MICITRKRELTKRNDRVAHSTTRFSPLDPHPLLLLFGSRVVDDLAEAYRLAVETMPIGESIAIVDDTPAKFKDFCDCVARVMGKPSVKSMPTWLATVISGQVVVEELTMNCRVKNTKAKEQLRWQPRYISYEQGTRSCASVV